MWNHDEDSLIDSVYEPLEVSLGEQEVCQMIACGFGHAAAVTRCVEVCLQCVCSVLQRVASSCSVLQRVSDDCMWVCDTLRLSRGVLQCVAACCSVLQRVAVCCSVCQMIACGFGHAAAVTRGVATCCTVFAVCCIVFAVCCSVCQMNTCGL